MPLLIKCDKLLKKCNKMWDKVCNITEIGFTSEPVYELIVFKVGRNYYPQVLLEVCKYIIKE